MLLLSCDEECIEGHTLKIHTTHQWVSATEHTCTCPGLTSELRRLDFECSPSTPEIPAYTDTQVGVVGMVGL